MLSFNRITRLLALAAVIVLGGCGLHPLYAPLSEDAAETDTAVAQDLASIAVDPIADRRGQELRNRLTAMLRQDDVAANSRYRLSVALGETQQSLAVRQTGFATRSNLRITATYTLIEVASGQPLVGGSVSAISSYDLLDNDFSTLTAINDARSRVVQRIAGDLRNRLAVYFASQPAVPATP